MSQAASLADRLRNVHVGLRPDLEIARQTFHGQPAYVLRDPISFQSHQLSAADYQVVVSLDEAKTLGEVFGSLVATGVVDPTDEAGFYAFIVSLQRLGVLQLPVVNSDALYAKFDKRRRDSRRRQLTRFLFWRIPLGSPDRMLGATVRWIAPLFTRTAFFIWLAVMLGCGWIVAARWSDFVDPLESTFSSQNLVAIWLLVIVLKAMHEFGHAYACKAFGGAVPEMGAYLIMFTPCAYVDASAAWGFVNRRHRIIVSLAGMYFESIIAAAALCVWCFTGPGPLHATAHHVVVLATIVTLGFNANPLMRYDGYYVLVDLVSMPNLRQKAIEAVRSVGKRWLLGLKTPPPTNRTEHALLVTYGAAATVYRALLLTTIGVVIAWKIHVVGLFVAIVFVGGSLMGMVVRTGRYLLASDETRPVRVRATVLAACLVVGLPTAVLLLPVPNSVVSRGVSGWEFEQTVYCTSPGFLRKVSARPGEHVEQGAELAVLDNDEVELWVTHAEAELARHKRVAEGQVGRAPSAADAAWQQLHHAERLVQHNQRQHAELTVRAPDSGIVASYPLRDKLGRYVAPGDPIAVVGHGSPVVRTLLTAEQLAQANPHTGEKVQVRLAGPGQPVRNAVVLEVPPQGDRVIQHNELTQEGGGEIAARTDTKSAAEPFFEVAVALEDDGKPVQAGRSARVRFSNPPETLFVLVERRFLRFLNSLRGAQN
ncbi:MAG: HlyD family efflux transporter periplasmic adaptor subunit [Pirellulales bacterium]|nr:HlyD family efflux transporter periplasmic adaptor subunit [Planctomycetales bacterium]